MSQIESKSAVYKIKESSWNSFNGLMEIYPGAYPTSLDRHDSKQVYEQATVFIFEKWNRREGAILSVTQKELDPETNKTIYVEKMRVKKDESINPSTNRRYTDSEVYAKLIPEIEAALKPTIESASATADTIEPPPGIIAIVV